MAKIFKRNKDGFMTCDGIIDKRFTQIIKEDVDIESESEDDEIEFEIVSKNEVKEKVKKDVKEDVKEDVKKEIKEEVKEEVKTKDEPFRIKTRSTLPKINNINILTSKIHTKLQF